MVTDVLMADVCSGQYLTYKIQGKGIALQVDTGSRVMLLDERTFVKLGEPKLQPLLYQLQKFIGSTHGEVTSAFHAHGTDESTWRGVDP